MLWAPVKPFGLGEVRGGAVGEGISMVDQRELDDGRVADYNASPAAASGGSTA